MKTVTVDNFKRVRLPDVTPKTIFSYHHEADGSVRLIPVKEEESKCRFPPGSLKRYFTPEKNAEELALLAGCSLEVPE